MSTADIVLLVGQLVGAWAIGFAGGFVITKFRDAVSKI